jgi:uncharacterized membrane protein YfcA
LEFGPLDIILIFAAFLLAGFVKGMVGMGLPPIAMGIMGLTMAPANAAALVVIPAFLMNIWQMTAGLRLYSLLRRFLTLQLGLCIGTYIGSFFIDTMNSRYLSVALGLVLIVYGLLNYFTARFNISRSQEWWLSPIIGLGTGLVMAATGLVMVPLVPYLQSLDLDKEAFIQTLGITFVVAAVALGFMLAHAGYFSLAVAGTSLLATIPVAIGMLIGRFAFKRILPEAFRLIFLVAITALGAAIVYRAAF